MNLWYHVGSKDEERRQRGFAHLFEHLMFEGSEHFPGDFFRNLQAAGAEINGSTSPDRTNYYVTLPCGSLDLALAMEADRMGCLLPALDDRKLRVQKDVVKNEYRQNYANRPYGLVSRHLAEALYPPWHPYSWLTIGVMEDVEAASRDDVAAFFERYYVPANASLCVVGGFEPERVRARIEQLFGGIPGGARSRRPLAPPVDLGDDRRITLYERVELERFYDSWHTVGLFHPDEAPLALLADVLGRGRASRLYRLLVVERELAQTVAVSQASRELGGTFSVVVTLRPECELAAVEAAVVEAVSELARGGPSVEELRRAQQARLASFVYALEDPGGFGGVADRLNAYNIFQGDPGLIVSDSLRYQAVTTADLQRVAMSYLVERPRVSLEVRRQPVRVGATVTPAESRALLAPATPFAPPVPVVVSLRGGGELWVLPRPELPMVVGSVVALGGASAHGADQAGLAQLTAAMMMEGTHQHGEECMAQAIQALGSVIATGSGHDAATLSFRCLEPCLERTLELLVEIQHEAAFPVEAWQRVRARTLAALRADRDHAETRARNALFEAIYSPRHSYGLPLDGVPLTVERLERAELVAFHEAQYRRRPSLWVVAGDVEADRLATLLERLVGPSAGRLDAPPAPADPGPIAAPTCRVLDRPGAAQAVLRMGLAGASRGDPDFIELVLFNHILGGHFASRLNETLREERGLTYGARSQFDFRRGKGPFLIATGLQADRLGEALALIHHELDAILGDRPPTSDELDKARLALIEGQARHYQTPSNLVSRYAGLVVHDLPRDEPARFAQRVRSATLDGVNAAAHRVLGGQSMARVIVADWQRVAPGLRAALPDLEIEVEGDHPPG